MSVVERFNKEDVKNAIVELKKLQKEHLHLGDRLCHIYGLAIASLEQLYPEILLDRNNERKYDLIIFRCKGCIEDLKEYNPYVYYNGEQIPLNKIEVIKVPYEFCENNEINLDNHWMTPIRLNDCNKKPWLLKTYENSDLRNQGIPHCDVYETFNDALKAGKYAIGAYVYDGFEIVLKYKEEGCDEEEIAIYGHFEKSKPYHKGFYLIR